MAFKIRASFLSSDFLSLSNLRILFPPFVVFVVVCVVTIGCGCGLTTCVVFVWVCTVSVPVSGPVTVGLTVCVVGPVGTGAGLVVGGVVVGEVGDVTLVVGCVGVVGFGVTPMGDCTGVGFTGVGWTG